MENRYCEKCGAVLNENMFCDDIECRATSIINLNKPIFDNNEIVRDIILGEPSWENCNNKI